MARRRSEHERRWPSSLVASGRTKWIRRALLVSLLISLTAIGGPATAGHIPPGSATYTTDLDFDDGVLLNVNHDAPNNDQLQLNEVAEPFPFVNIAASARGTVVRIDVNTGAILGEYLTAPDGMGRNPSRTTVDKLGNVWVGNRDEFGDGKGSVARIGLVIGGTRADADGTPNPAGQYLKPPFSYSTCIDRDADNLIKTSTGLANILPWSNAGGADSNGGVSTAEDECVINYTRVTGTGTRTVAVDPNNDLWTGGADSDHEKLDGSTGHPIAGTQFNLGCGGYGGLIDRNNVLWSARFGNNLLRYDVTAGTGVCLGIDHGDYGLGIDPMTGEIWHSNLFGNRIARLAPDGTLIAAYPHGEENAQGVAVDGVGNVWVAHSLFGSTTVGHLRTDGTFVGNVPLPGGNGPTGVAVDANGKVWVANINTDNAQRIDPSAGPIGGGGFSVGAVDLTVSLGAGAGPYNYSDMTGFVAIGSTSPSGSWTVVRDGGAPGTPWGTISWNNEPQGSEPPGTSIEVEARAADTQAGLGGQPFINVSNGVPVSLIGQFIEVRATLTASAAGTSPVLSDISVQTAAVEADLSLTKTDAPDPVAVGGNLTYTLTVTNNGPDPSTGSTVTDTLPAGVTFVSATPSQGSCLEAGGTVTCMLGPLAVGASATVEIVVTVSPTAISPLSDTATVSGVEPDPLAGNNSATAETTVTVRQLDHFKCYALREGDDDDDDRVARPRVTLKDQFGSGDALVGAAVELCNPVSKDGGTINQGNAHLVKHKAKPVGRTFSNRRVEVTNQFGTQILTVRKPAILVVPSSKSTSGPPGDPPTTLDHFHCYRFVDDDDRSDFTPRTVVLKDQFKEETVRVRRPTALCNPVAKAHAGQVSPIGSPNEHLVCYAIRAGRFAGSVNVRNQFGDATLRVRRPVSLCVPSEKRELPPPIPDDDD